MAEPRRPASAETGDTPEEPLLAGAEYQSDRARSMLFEAFARVVYPTVLVVAAYLFLVGLHRPGGGFAAGLTIGLGLLLRRLAGGPHELGAAFPIPPGVLLGGGLALASGYGVAGLLIGGHVLHGTVLHVNPPGLPAQELPTSLIFELGIAAIVVGLAVDVLRTLGAEDAEP